MWQAAASAFGSVLQYKSQRETNKLNKNIAEDNRNWQKMMSDTAHQREVKDLKAAGLNPILSVTGGSGASTPSGSTATMVSPGSGIGDAGLATAKLVADLKLNKELRKTEQTKQKLNNANANVAEANAVSSALSLNKKSVSSRVWNTIANIYDSSAKRLGRAFSLGSKIAKGRLPTVGFASIGERLSHKYLFDKLRKGGK